MIDNTVKQWRRRLRSCVAAKGGHFEQSLHVKHPTESVMLYDQQLCVNNDSGRFSAIFIGIFLVISGRYLAHWRPCVLARLTENS